MLILEYICHDPTICITSLTNQLKHFYNRNLSHTKQDTNRERFSPWRTRFHINYKAKGHRTRFFETESSFVEHRCRREWLWRFNSPVKSASWIWWNETETFESANETAILVCARLSVHVEETNTACCYKETSLL